jgi:hypothetical protein
MAYHVLQFYYNQGLLNNFTFRTIYYGLTYPEVSATQHFYFEFGTTF